MQRRKFMIGLGSLAAGSAAAMGTGATTTFGLNDRGVGADVVTDSNGNLALESKTPETEIVRENDNGELEIDFTNDARGFLNAQGVNVGAEVEIGDLSDPQNDPAFVMRNQMGGKARIHVRFTAGQNFQSDGSELVFLAKYNGRSPGPQTVIDGGVSAGDTVDLYDQSDFGQDFLPGQRIFWAIRVDTDNSGSNTNENLSGTLHIDAELPP